MESTGDKRKQSAVRIRSKSFDASTKKERPKTGRTAMGDYIIPKGGRPLTALMETTPGAQKYRPNTTLVLPKAPEYTLKGHLRELSKLSMPSPSEYDSGKDLVWTDKRFSLTPKDITWPYDPRKEAHLTCTPGSGHYKLTYGDTGAGLKRSCSAKYKGRIQVGPPNSLVQPADTEGFQTPGSKYWPKPEKGPRYSLSAKTKRDEAIKEESLGPGPAAYTIATKPPPAPLIGEVAPELKVIPTPAPNEYDISSSFGLGPKRTFGIKTEEKISQIAPPPNTYDPKRPESAISTTVTYRAFSVPPDQRPSPADHTVRPQSVLVHNPEYSCRKNCLPVYPDILQYPEHTALEPPGPGEYETDREFHENTNPKYSVGLPIPQPSNTNPSPNKYVVKHDTRSDIKRPPQYTMGRRFSESDVSLRKQPNPGPADYSPKKILGRPPSSRIIPRRKALTAPATPAANQYDIAKGLTKKGSGKNISTSMKGRQSPFVYSGFSNVSMYRCSTLS